MVYDVSRAFERIENELLESMIRNLKKHKAEETELGFEWTQWQAVQLEELQRFKLEVSKKYGLEFKSMNQKIRETIAEAMMQGASDEEVNVLKAIEKGLVLNREQGLSAGFFQANQKRLDALMNAVEHDMKTAQTAVLRYTNDQYRKIIFQSQVAASSGALTYDKAVDMATSDFLKKGINCITYSNGAVHNIASYADMAVRTASKRAYLMGEGQKRQEWGISTVILNKRFNACPLCMPFEGKVLIDDVWSGGTSKDGPYPLMSSAMAAGLYHPNCKDKHSTYFEGISPKPESRYYEEKPVIEERQRIENKLNHAKRQAKSYNRLAKNSLDAENQETYRARATEWRDKVKEYREELNRFDSANDLNITKTESQTIFTKTNVKDLPKRLQKTLFDYTNGEFRNVCEWSQYITDKDNFRSTYLWDEGKSISKSIKEDVDDIHELIKEQPKEKGKLIRFERANHIDYGRYSGMYENFKEGNYLNLGIRSTTRDLEFVDKLLNMEVEGLESYHKRANEYGHIKYVFDSSRSLDVSNISAYPDQLEELVYGKYKITKVTHNKGVDGGYEYIRMPMKEYVKENNLETEIRISKKGNENIVVHMKDGKERLYPKTQWDEDKVFLNDTVYIQPKFDYLEVHLEYVDE
ncbi:MULTISPECIES: phage minor capsid protein [unclassified Granulicatella]|uniref:phage minor capsid protein n=1 Tax=unclassified Granulicatella TaxID=2630493 RepID=UPI00069E937B|nr:MULTISPECIES: phage minor capsid protein [unclassified Granulicatella]